MYNNEFFSLPLGVALENQNLLVYLAAAAGRNSLRKGWDGQRNQIGWKSALDSFGILLVEKGFRNTIFVSVSPMENCYFTLEL